MFSFLNMMGNYENRKVARYENGDFFVSTVRVTDSEAPFETAVAHPAYNNGKIVIVENYWTREDAEAGHGRWVETMTSPILPEKLRDSGMSYVNQMLDMVNDNWRDEIE